MLTAIKGTFRNGRVELDEEPRVASGTAVVVTFLAPDPMPGTAGQRQMTFGMLGRPGDRMSELDDFTVAEHAGDDWDGGTTP